MFEQFVLILCVCVLIAGTATKRFCQDGCWGSWAATGQTDLEGGGSFTTTVTVLHRHLFTDDAVVYLCKFSGVKFALAALEVLVFKMNKRHWEHKCSPAACVLLRSALMYLNVFSCGELLTGKVT